MKLPALAMHNRQFTIVAFILLSIFGITAFLKMPRTENPTIFIPGGGIVAVYPGASPQDMEQLIAIPLEEAINELSDINRMNTTISDGLVTVTVEFNYNTDANTKFDELQRKVTSARRDMPKDLHSLEVMQWTSADVVIMHLALVSDHHSYAWLEQKGEALKKQIEKLNGISKVMLMAYPEQEVRITLNTEKMALMGITMSQIANVMQSQNVNIPGGSIKLGSYEYAVKTSGAYASLSEIENTIVASWQGSIVYLRDIATVTMDYANQDYIGMYSNAGDQEHKALFIGIQQKEEHNIFSIMETLQPELEQFNATLPAGSRLHTVFDQSEFVNTRINGFLLNLLQGIILVGIVIFLALGMRQSVIVIIAIPLSILIGMGFVDLSGFGLQQISIAALVVALGLLVDNSIVMVENIHRHIRLGYGRAEAAIKATSEIGWPVVSATFTTLLAFVPIIMMPDKTGDFIKSLPVTIIFTLIISLLIALTLTPLLASIFLKKPEEQKPHNNTIAARSANIFVRALERFIEGPYRRLLKRAMHQKWLTLSVLMLLIIGTLSLFPLVGISFFPKAEQPHLLIGATLPEGAAIETTKNEARAIQQVLDSLPQVDYYAINVGHGNPRIYYNVFPKQFASNFAEFYVTLKSYDVEEFNGLISFLRNRLGNIPDMKVTIKEFEQGTPIEAPVVVYVMGEDIDLLRNYTDSVKTILETQPGTINIVNELDRDKTEFKFTINRDKASLLGIPSHEIDKTIRMSIHGLVIDEYRDERGKRFNIVMGTPGEFTPEDIRKIYVESLTGKIIPLSMVAETGFHKAPGKITRYNMQRYGAVKADLDGTRTLDEVLVPVMEQLELINLPEGFSYKIRGEYESRQESFGGMGMALLLAAIAIFAVLVLQFKSFLQPVIIFIAFPLGAIGMVWALLLSGYHFSFTAFIGFISLSGIVINNSIILVDYTNRLRQTGIPKKEALIQAGETRFIPIILTTLTTIGGLLPLTLQGGSLWAPMGWTIIGGLLVSTFLTLLIVPVLYLLLIRK